MSRLSVRTDKAGSQVLGPNGELLWSAATPNDLVVLLIEELVRERQRRAEISASLAIATAQANTAVKVARDILKPLLLDAVNLIRELDKQNGDRCMLGDLHSQRARIILACFDRVITK